MNYIQQLKNENAELREKIVLSNMQLSDLLVYLNSEKFRCGNELDGYVNIQDIVNRLHYIEVIK